MARPLSKRSKSLHSHGSREADEGKCSLHGKVMWCSYLRQEDDDDDDRERCDELPPTRHLK